MNMNMNQGNAGLSEEAQGAHGALPRHADVRTGTTLPGGPATEIRRRCLNLDERRPWKTGEGRHPSYPAYAHPDGCRRS